jgi:hypothetical protein
MSVDAERLINGHLDGTLTTDERASLCEWLKASSENADRFAQAVMLHNRIRVHYESLRETEKKVDSIRVASVPRPRYSRQSIVAASLACVLLGAFLFLSSLSGPSPRAAAIAEFHQLVILGRRPADRTYRITYVKDPSDRSETPGKHRENPENKPDDPARPGNEPMLYVRDGRQFVYSRKALDGRQFIIGSNGQQSWAIKPGEPAEVSGPLNFTEGLPAGLYLAPVLSFFDGQEKMLVNDYNLELRIPTKSAKVFVAVKKPDTKQGPRRIEISFSAVTGQIAEMRIWPETPDHRRTSHTLIQLVSEQKLADNWFNHECHHPDNQQKSDASI